MKKLLSLIILAVLCVSMTTAFTGCGESSKSGENGTLYVYNWDEYIDTEIIDMFEEETGIKVVYDVFDTNEALYAKLASGEVSYDVLCPSDYMIAKMVANDMLSEINFDNTPNYQYIGEQYLETSKAFDPENLYSVPYCWGTLGILYNTELVDENVDSWEILFNEKYSGNIVMMDSVRDSFCVALSYLGYSINTIEENELNEASDLLKEQKPLVQAYEIDYARERMINESAAIAVIYSGEALYSQSENDNLEYVVPKEGSNVWLDSWVIPKNAQNKEAAEAWINFLCKPEIALMNLEYITYSTPNTAVYDLLEDEELKNADSLFPAEDVLGRCNAFSYLGEDGDALYNKLWENIKSASN